MFTDTAEDAMAWYKRIVMGVATSEGGAKRSEVGFDNDFLLTSGSFAPFD